LRYATLWCLISAYQSVATPWHIPSPDEQQHIVQGFDVFIDDTDIITATPVHTNSDPVPIAQQNLNLWHNILQASGGELNPSKCVWLYFHWTFDAKGHPSLTKHHPNTGPQMTVMLCSNAPTRIQRLRSDEPHWYLGIQLTTDGNYKKEVEIFQQRNKRYITLLQTCPFNHHDIQTIYKQCYLPTVSYPLPAMHILLNKLYDLQSAATTVFLTKLGYLWTFPRSMVYASASRGGLGFRHLRYEQGLQKCMQLIKQIRTATSMGVISQIIMEHYQLMAGISKPVLKDTCTLSWSNAKWFDTMWQWFLHEINGQIIFKKPGISLNGTTMIVTSWRMC